MTQCKGKLLTHEQSTRLALMDKLDRDHAIALIVAHLRKDACTHSASWGGTPRQAYAAPVGRA